MISLSKKALLTGLILIAGINTAFAQRPLTLSKEHSEYTYIYQLTTPEILNFYKHPEDDLNEKILVHPIDSFKTASYWKNNLPAGNYLQVSAQKNRLKYAILENHSAFIKILHNNYDQRFVLVDKQGNNITSASVSFNGKGLKFDNSSATWHTKSDKKQNIVQADFEGVSNFFIVKQQGYDRDDDEYSNWLNSLWSSIKKIFNKEKRYRYRQKTKPYNGFIVFNKPQYKPNDTIKFKAFILNSKTKLPITQKKLTVKLISNYSDKGIAIGTVNSYRDGGFEFSFPLGDTLDLDNTYTVALSDPDVKKNIGEKKQSYSLYNNPAIMLYGSFYYEEYELKSTNFNMRVDKKEHWRGSPLAVYLKATDENDLPIADGRVKLILKTTNSTFYKQKHVFVPDTLWKHELKLDPVGETKIVVPDSIFPRADIDYQIEATFLNSNNEERISNEYVTFRDDRFNIITNLSNDTLSANYQQYGKDIEAPAIISALSANNDTISKLKIKLPSKILFNPNVAKYSIKTDSADTEVELKDSEAQLSINGERTADSLFVKINNPRNLHFWYSVFAGNQLIDAGEANKLFYKKAYNQQKIVTFWVNYIWGGQPKTAQAALVYRKDLLTINVKQPVSVYPGQRIQTDIVVTNAAGKPVGNVDLTAWALTKKFENYRPPSLPYTGYNYNYRNTRKGYEVENTNANSSLKLNWKRWSKEMGLDSIQYYKFTNPTKIYIIEEPGIDTITQIAPFVVKDGEIKPVHILYIDEKPVYFSQAQQIQHYSFAVKPGRHNLKFRTADQSIQLDSVYVERSKKLILSVNANAYPGKKLTDTLDTYEAGLINNYLITVIDNFDINQAIIKQNDLLFYLNPYPVSGNGGRVLTGPLADNNATLYVKGQIPRQFTAEPNYSYLFEPGLLKQKSIAAKYPFNTKISIAPGITDYTQYVLSQHAADSLWQNYLDTRSNTLQLFQNDNTLGQETGRLQFEREVTKGDKPLLLKNIIIYKYGEPDFIKIFPGNNIDLGYLDKGKYRILFLLQGDRYDIKENISIQPNGLNHYKSLITPTHQRDSVSIKISNVINNRPGRYNYTDAAIENDALKIKEAFNEKYAEEYNFTEVITGRVFEKGEKLPLIRVSVRVKGSAKGTVTDINGNFTIKVPHSGKLLFNYIGYESKEVSITPGTDIKVTLDPSAKYLQEVVVLGYGSLKKQSLIGSVSTITSLNGMVAGLQVVDDYGDQANLKTIHIRGVSTLPGQAPLYIIDGNIVESLAGIKPTDISDINILKSAAAAALYGSRAANGVVIITTKKSTDNQAAPASTIGMGEEYLRKNFADYAYWQPKLTTNTEGKASFTTTFPDDITNWRTFIMGISGERQTGYKEGQIKAFKPISANFIAPQFAVEGDEMKLIGKVMNYNNDAVKLTRAFTYNGTQQKQGNITVINSQIDTLAVIATPTDSLSFEYTIKRDNGYFDGERRKVPVVKQGVEETKGIFEALNSDTTVTLKFDATMGPVTFRAEASVLPTLMEESRKLREYKYLCNEQLASKLKGLLAERRIKKFMGEEFKYGKNVQEVIKKLQENRRSNGTWGWWKDTDEELWISLHAVEALLDAQTEGYLVQLDKQKLTDYLVYQLEAYQGADKLTCLELLYKLKAKVDYKKYITIVDVAQKSNKQRYGYQLSSYDKLRMMLIRQQTGENVKLDSLLAKEHHTLFGNIYWGEDSYRFLDNSIQLSAMAYQLIKSEGKHPEILQKIRGYFLEQRGRGDWRNTYESALILETILPDVLVDGKQAKPASITIKGVSTTTISKFPYTATFTAQDLGISKTGSLPVYITGSQQFWNPKPIKISKDFTVNTWFERNAMRITQLKGGEPVTLQAEITARGDADFVMIEIPIPAGCSYENKDQSWGNNEVHREYFKEKVSIFCRKLKQGKYTFTVNLIPRYDGQYIINPAKAEMMYFPVFYGREGMKQVVIGK